MISSLLDRIFLRDTAARPAGARLWVAYSGGLDSSVLLHLLTKKKWPGLHAVHVHHGLQAAADAWARHCQAQCEQWRVPLRVLRVTVEDQGSGLEAAARRVRYQAIRELMKDGDVLITAHHREDQAETLLLRLLRGSGVRGLAAMRRLTPFAPGTLWRPLLKTPRREVRAYAEAQGLRWIEDPHNADPRFARSLLRAKIMPRLSERWPHAAECFGRAAEACAEGADLLDELADLDLENLSDLAGTLHIPGLLGLTSARRRNALRRWLARRQLALPHADSLTRVDTEVLRAAADAEPCLAWPGAEFRRYRDRLHAMRNLPAPPTGVELDWDGREPLQLPAGCGVLECSGALPEKSWRVCFPGGGERMRPAGAGHRRTLKNLFQEQGVPVWTRERTPLLCDETGLRWAGGLGFSEPALNHALIRWQTSPVDSALTPDIDDLEE